ncbi:MAG TPA: hypothetical protein VG406_30165 [Isosphaeraceae bacterium]|jgi:hypothetical protein|nr:hypothetical protein [Isosphaeraceae bacterium]
MPFTSYTSHDVARAHNIHCRRESFVAPIPARLSDSFREELAFTMSEVPFDRSEAAACETLSYPMLREVWKPYHESLTLWSHMPIRFDDDLSGVPDYLVARRSPLWAIVFDGPYLWMIIEAKKDDFERGWGQCLAAMLVAQRLTDHADRSIYGITTNGFSWQFGRLLVDAFVKDLQTIDIHDADRLAATINSLMAACRDEAAKETVAA